MSDADRADRRRRKKALVDLGTKHLKAGLQKRAPRDVLAAVTIAFGHDAKTPSELAALQHAGFETAARIGAPSSVIACKKGCDFCCHSRVLVSAPEAFRLDRAVRAKGPTYLLEFRQRAAKVSGRTTDERFGKKLPCPALVGGACTVYADRPLNCRQVTSYAVEPCQGEFEGVAGTISMPAHGVLHAENLRIAEAASLLTAGKPVAFYELSQAVLCALETPDAEQRWMAGDGVFGSIAHDPAVAGGVEAEARTVATLAAQALELPNPAPLR